MAYNFYTNDPRPPANATVAKLHSLTPASRDEPPILFWAEKGVVRYFDERQKLPVDRCGTVTVEEMKERLLSYDELLTKARTDGFFIGRSREEQRKGWRYLEDMERVLREAYQQGDRRSKKVRRELVARSPVTVSLSGLKSPGDVLFAD